jgi:hypothetical protein
MRKHTFTGFLLLSVSSFPTFSIKSKTFKPSKISPKTTCFPSSLDVSFNVMKNCEVFEFFFPKKK